MYRPPTASISPAWICPSRGWKNSLPCNRDDWYAETEDIAGFFQQFGTRFPRHCGNSWNRSANGLQLRSRCSSRAAKSGRWPRSSTKSSSARTRTSIGMLSELGKRLFFPKGILAQSAEAKDKAKRYDATIGIAREKGKPMFLALGDEVLQRPHAGRDIDLRSGHRPARPAEEVARGAAPQEPQPGQQKLFAADRHRRRDARLEPCRRLVPRSGRHGAAARQVLGELRAALRRADAGAVGHVSLLQRSRRLQRRRPAAGAGHAGRQPEDDARRSISPTTPRAIR